MISCVGFENNGTLVVTLHVAQLPTKCSTWMEGWEDNKKIVLNQKRGWNLTLPNHGGLQNIHAWRIHIKCP